MFDRTLVTQLRFALDTILPSAVAAAVDQAADKAEPFQYSEEGRHLANAAVRRRNEFIAGRRSARAALASIGYPACALPPDIDRVPVWPGASIGSISHSCGLCCAVAASTHVFKGLGVDLEKTTRMRASVMEHVLHPLEAAYIGSDQALGSLIFSAKEAFFKAQFPIWRAQPGFKDLALHLERSVQQLSVVEIASHLPEELCAATQGMQLRYQFFGEYVVTVCWLQHAQRGAAGYTMPRNPNAAKDRFQYSDVNELGPINPSP